MMHSFCNVDRAISRLVLRRDSLIALRRAIILTSPTAWAHGSPGAHLKLLKDQPPALGSSFLFLTCGRLQTADRAC